MPSEVWIGVDPGQGQFRGSPLRIETAAMTCAVDNVDQAIEWVMREIDGEVPQAAGIECSALVVVGFVRSS